MAEWSDEDIARIKQMTADGKSASQIGVALSPRRSRNSIIGWWFRNNISVPQKPRGRLPGRTAAAPRAHASEPMRPRTHISLPRPVWKRERKPKTPVVAKVIEPAPTLLPPLLVTMANLSPNGCAWPMNDGGPYLYCGNDRGNDRSYCAAHRRLSRGS